MRQRRFNPAQLSPPPGGLYSHVVQVGDTVYLSGQLARDADGNVVGEGDVAAQFRQVWANVSTALESVGGSLDDLVKTTTFVVGPDNIAAVREARQQALPKSPPASTMVVVAALADPACLVEVEGIAVLHSD